MVHHLLFIVAAVAAVLIVVCVRLGPREPFVDEGSYLSRPSGFVLPLSMTMIIGKHGVGPWSSNVIVNKVRQLDG